MNKKTLEAVAALIKKQDKYLLAQRKRGDCYGNLWEFPGGAIEPGERHKEAIEREIKEELGAKVKANQILGKFFDQNHRLRIEISLISCVVKDGPFQAKDCQDFGFFSLEEIGKLDLAPADKKIFNYLKDSKNETKTA